LNKDQSTNFQIEVSPIPVCFIENRGKYCELFDHFLDIIYNSAITLVVLNLLNTPFNSERTFGGIMKFYKLVLVLILSLSIFVVACDDDDDTNNNSGLCANVTCATNGTCNPADGLCACDTGFVGDGTTTCAADLCFEVTCNEANTECNDADGECVCVSGYTVDATGDCIVDETAVCDVDNIFADNADAACDGATVCLPNPGALTTACGDAAAVDPTNTFYAECGDTSQKGCPLGSICGLSTQGATNGTCNPFCDASGDHNCPEAGTCNIAFGGTVEEPFITACSPAK
jgi:hypothetical protein